MGMTVFPKLAGQVDNLSWRILKTTAQERLKTPEELVQGLNFALARDGGRIHQTQCRSHI